MRTPGGFRRYSKPEKAGVPKTPAFSLFKMTRTYTCVARTSSRRYFYSVSRNVWKCSTVRGADLAEPQECHFPPEILHGPNSIDRPQLVVHRLDRRKQCLLFPVAPFQGRIDVLQHPLAGRFQFFQVVHEGQFYKCAVERVGSLPRIGTPSEEQGVKEIYRPPAIGLSRSTLCRATFD